LHHLWFYALAAKVNGICARHVKSLTDHSVAAYANAFPNLGMLESLILDEGRSARCSGI